MRNDEYKILWISDIHFSIKYEEAFTKKPVLALYLTQFKHKVEQLIQSDHGRGYDYIFLTGDLAQAGTEADYKLLFAKFLKPLLDVLISFPGPYPKVVVIPGNHDVDWQKSEFLKEYVRKIEPGKKEPVERATYLANNIPEFKKLFTDYRKFLMEFLMDVEGGRYRDFFSMDNSMEFKVSPEYQEHRLFGYLVDHKRRLIINLVNTAWYSLGGRFNSILAELESAPELWNIYEIPSEEKKDHSTVGSLIKKHTATRLKHVLNKKEYISEYNSQITGINLFELDDMQKIRDEYGEYFVITCMHHPFNWLRWDEQYDFNVENEESNSRRLFKLISASNLILTGHEHVPKQIDGEAKSESCVMLKSGCFLFDNQHTAEGSLDNGWFSVLHIDPDKATVRQDKHYYTVKAPDGIWEDLISDRSKTSLGYYRLRKRNSGYPSGGTRLELVTKMIYDTTETQLLEFLNSIFDNKEKVNSVNLLKSEPEALFFFVQRSGNEELREMCILLRKENAYTEIRKDSFAEKLILMAADLPERVSIFRFLVLDIFIDAPDLSRLPDFMQQQYLVADRSAQLQLKTEIGDDMFDVMRYKLFVDFETRFAASGTMPSEFELIRDAKFINTIIPFWIAEQIWRSALKQYV